MRIKAVDFGQIITGICSSNLLACLLELSNQMSTNSGIIGYTTSLGIIGARAGFLKQQTLHISMLIPCHFLA
jgi:hypothetical protein